MIDPAGLAALAAVLRCGGFEAAAADLGLTQPAVSQRIRALEERLGLVLVERTKPARATPAGARLARHFGEIALLEQDLARELGLPGEGAAPLRIAVNADSLATWFLPALAQVPGTLFDLVVDDEGHSADWLRRGEVLAAVTAHAQPVQGCDIRPLGALRYIAAAAPGFVARWFPDGPDAATLAAAPAIVFNAKDRLQAKWAAQVAGRQVRLPCHHVPSAEGFVSAALLGLGWCLHAEPLVAGHIAAGRLVALRPDLSFTVALSWQWARRVSGPLSPLTQAVRRAAAAVLTPPSAPRDREASVCATTRRRSP